MKVGAGGFVTGLDIAPDGTKVVRTDSAGALIWSDSASQWAPLLTTTTMPTGDSGGGGAYEVAVAHSNSNRIYVIFNGRVFRSDDKGRSFRRATPPELLAANANDNYRVVGRKMAVDPVNPDVVFVGTQGGPLWLTTDGGASWAKVATVPPAKTAMQGMRIAIDPTSVKGGRCLRVFVYSAGNGVLVSQDGGQTFAPTSASPDGVLHMTVDLRGVLWASCGFGGGNLRSFNGTAWSTAAPASLHDFEVWCIAVDPRNADRLVVNDAGGRLSQSFDRGATWTWANSNNRIADDVPWLAWTSEGYMSCGELCFDPTVANKLYFSEGIGVWWASPAPTWGTTDWHSQSVGIDQLVSNQIISPPGGKPLYLAWDRPVFRIDDPDVFPKTHGPDNVDSILMGWAADWAPDDPKTVLLLANWQADDRSGVSRDGGVTWTRFETLPTDLVPDRRIGGSIAAGGRNNFMILPNNNGTPWFTKDGGKTWARSSVPGVPLTGSTGWGYAYYFHRFALVADRVATGTFYLYNYEDVFGGVYRSTDGGATFTRVFTGQIVGFSMFHAQLYAVPGKQGHLFFTCGLQENLGAYAAFPFMHSTDGGATWSAVGASMVIAAGFGKAAAGKDYPAIYIYGFVGGKLGMWRSDDQGATWTDLGASPLDVPDAISAVSGDPDTYGKVYVGYASAGAAYGAIS